MRTKASFFLSVHKMLDTNERGWNFVNKIIKLIYKKVPLWRESRSVMWQAFTIWSITCWANTTTYTEFEEFGRNLE